MDPSHPHGVVDVLSLMQLGRQNASSNCIKGKHKVGIGEEQIRRRRGTRDMRKGVRDGERTFRHGDRDRLDPITTAITNTDTFFWFVGTRFSNIAETRSSVEMSLVGD